MLSRTASELFWMARYLERAESFARVLDVTYKLSMVPRHSQQQRDLALPLNLSLTHDLFQARYPQFSMANLINFFALDSDNPSSIYSCVERAWNTPTQCAAASPPRCGSASTPRAFSCARCGKKGWKKLGSTPSLTG